MKNIYYNNNIIETFIFDLDGTAFEFTDCTASINSEGKVLEYICKFFPSLILHDIYKLSKKSMNIDRNKWFLNVLKLIEEKYSIRIHDINSFADDLETLYWTTFTQLNHPFFDFIYFIEKITPFCKIGIITDGYIRNQKIKIFSSGLYKYFNFSNIVFSDEINSSKPSPEIFNYAQKKIAYNPKTTAFIGDSLKKDVAGANKAGLLSIFLKRRINNSYTPTEKIEKPQITVRSYYDLLDIIEIK